MTRSDIRYALFRCRSGNATDAQMAVLEPYRLAMQELKLDIHQFGEDWDIGPIAPFDSVVTGGRLMMLQEIRDASVVDKNGKPTDPFVAAVAGNVTKGK